jgi:hypothetical protein
MLADEGFLIFFLAGLGVDKPAIAGIAVIHLIGGEGETAAGEAALGPLRELCPSAS